MKLASRSTFVDLNGINCRLTTEPFAPTSCIVSAPMPEGDSFLDHSPPLARTDPVLWPNGSAVGFRRYAKHLLSF
jgi:hypothetical protein